MITTTYGSIRPRIKAADLIAFSGEGFFSNVVKYWTRSTVSHVGIILTTEHYDGICVNHVIEATSLDNFCGVTTNRLSIRVARYNGVIWWLPLKESLRERLNEKGFFTFLLNQEGKPYDKAGAVFSGIDWFDRIPLLNKLTRNKETFTSLFCSELAAGAYEAGGILPKINASEITPDDLCRMNIFENEYYKISGKHKKIAGFNSTRI